VAPSRVLLVQEATGRLRFREPDEASVDRRRDVAAMIVGEIAAGMRSD
jgi:hypothetical protein